MAPLKSKKRIKPVKVTIPYKYVLAVETGVEWLDLTLGRKNWLSRMDMTDFDISQTDTCVAGNVFRDAMFKDNNDGYDSFLSAMTALGTKTAGERFGFWAASDRGMGYLQDLWVRKIKALKSRR